DHGRDLGPRAVMRISLEIGHLPHGLTLWQRHCPPKQPQSSKSIQDTSRQLQDRGRGTLQTATTMQSISPMAKRLLQSPLWELRKSHIYHQHFRRRRLSHHPHFWP
ncbi:mCG145314, partial [Mus musculus]